jgi:microcystin-dependent protein
MSYKVQHTETTNPSKPPIIVEDQSLNTDTSVTFVGKNYPGYSRVIGENFLHLLENFAKNTAPANAVEGQLWYDNSPDVNLLKVYDGTQWTAAGSVKKATTAPSTGIVGDLWVNTNTQQLYVYSGSNWLLIGPQYSSGAKTGPDVETIVDINNIDHNVMTFYANNYRLAILSKESFTPKLLITGFETIGQGLNISTVDTTSTSSPTKFWGTASKADALVINNATVAAVNFLRTDVSSITNATIGVRANGGITVGSDLSFNVATDVASNSAVLYSKASGGNLDIRLTQTNGTITNVIRVDSTNRVGINNTAPQEALDVTGNIIASGDATIDGEVTATTLNINSTSTFTDDISTYGQTLINYLDIDGNPTTAAVILPGDNTADALYDIGSVARRFRNIYAQEFVGSFNGAFTGSLSGSITGSAAKLSSPTTFQLLGDVSSDAVSFDGQTPQTGYPPGVIKFTTTINQNLITAKDLATDSLSADQLLVYRSGTGSGLKRMSKQTFISTIPTVPIGAIFPYAGPALPAGYVLCDGGEVKIADYTELFGVIGYTYKPTGLIGKNTFALPDLRGRFPLGRDNMDNGTTVPDKDDPTILLDAGGGSANRVTSTAADNLGNGSGQEEIGIEVNNLPEHQHTLQSASQRQYYAGGTPSGTADPGTVPALGVSVGATGYGLPNSGGVDSTRHGDAINGMNPYLTINYIIFTGVL